MESTQCEGSSPWQARGRGAATVLVALGYGPLPLSLRRGVHRELVRMVWLRHRASFGLGGTPLEISGVKVYFGLEDAGLCREIKIFYRQRWRWNLKLKNIT